MKAANVLIDVDVDYKLVDKEEFDPLEEHNFICKVADSESSIAFVGTEILFAVKKKDLQPNLFTEKSDAYSYAMTCYETLTACMPFEGARFSNDDVVLGRERPKLPKSIKP